MIPLLEQVAAGAISLYALDGKMLSSKPLLLAGITTEQSGEDTLTKFCEDAAKVPKAKRPTEFSQLHDLKRDFKDDQPNPGDQRRVEEFTHTIHLERLASSYVNDALLQNESHTKGVVK